MVDGDEAKAAQEELKRAACAAKDKKNKAANEASVAKPAPVLVAS
jgi:hypothetical protein